MMRQITLITNICFEPYLKASIKDYFFQYSNDNIRVNYLSFEEYKHNLDYIKFADIIVVCLNFEALYPDIILDVLKGQVSYDTIEKDCLYVCKQLSSYVTSNSNAKLIWFGFEDYYCIQSNSLGSLLSFDGIVDRLNLSLHTMMLNKGTFIDVKRIIATIGIKNAYTAKNKYRWNAPYSKEVVNLMAAELYKQQLIITGITKKCLVIDCDNVLWKGILSEVGIEGIHIGCWGLGKPFRDFQRHLVDLYYHGVILAVCSKNDESDVLRVFNEHTGMLLKEEHIACFKCNWDNKADSIKSIAESLNIGLNSIVFVDDSVFETESIKSILPEVNSVLFNINSIYDDLSCFNFAPNVNTNTIQERISTYKTNTLRENLKQSMPSMEDYISSLNMKIDIHELKLHELSRATELIQRTNKCTNGVRYTLNQLKIIMDNKNFTLYTVTLADRFSNLGIVGVIGIYKNIINIFSLSCRALGRKIEEEMVDFIMKQNAIGFAFSDTGKNEDVKKLFFDNKLTEMFLQDDMF